MKKTLPIAIVLGLVFVGGVYYFTNKLTTEPAVNTGNQTGTQIITVPTDHTWTEYKNDKLGFVMAYPSDIAHPREITEPAGSDGIFPGAETVVFFDANEQQKYISLWVQQTNAKDASGWFKEVYGSDGKGWHISTSTKVANIDAVGVSENIPSIAHDNLDLNFVRSGYAWSLSFDNTRLTSADIEYIRQSFRFIK